MLELGKLLKVVFHIVHLLNNNVKKALLELTILRVKYTTLKYEKCCPFF